jgi:hypothetical protein
MFGGNGVMKLIQRILLASLVLSAFCMPVQLSSRVPANLLLGAMRKIVQRPGFKPTARKVAWGAWGAWVGVGLGCFPGLVREKNGGALIEAIGAQDSEKVAEALDCWNINIDRGWSRCGDNYSFSGRTALGWAIFYGNTEIVKQLLDAGADISLVDGYGNKAIDYVTFCKQSTQVSGAEVSGDTTPAIVEQPVEQKTEQSAESTEKEEPIRKSRPTFYPVPSMPILVPVSSPHLPAQSVDQCTNQAAAKLLKELIAAIKNRDAAGVQELLQTGVLVNQKDELGNTPLYYAIAYGFVEIARLLLDAGAHL